MAKSEIFVVTGSKMEHSRMVIKLFGVYRNIEAANARRFEILAKDKSWSFDIDEDLYESNPDGVDLEIYIRNT